MSNYKELKEIAWKANLDLPKYDLVIYTFGNVSAFDSDKGVLAIKPSGVSYDVLKPGDMVIVDLDNKIVEGKLNPSSDTKTHVVLYKNFKGIGGIVHTHSTYSVAWAQAMKPIPILGTTHADHLNIDVPCTKMMSDEEIMGDYETETGNNIVKRFKGISPDEVSMVLVAGHGPFTWGKTADKAVYNSVVLEELAKMAMISLTINPKIKTLQQSLIDRHYFRKHGADSYYGQKK